MHPTLTIEESSQCVLHIRYAVLCFFSLWDESDLHCETDAMLEHDTDRSTFHHL